VAVRIDFPEAALRLAILQSKARAMGLLLDSQLATRLALAIAGSVRRLEGALTRLGAHVRLGAGAIDETLATEVIAALRPKPAVPLGVDRILEETARAFAVSVSRLRGRSRRVEIVRARQAAMYLARTLLGRPFAELAAEFTRNHTTVLHACRSVAARLQADQAFGTLLAELAQRLTGIPRGAAGGGEEEVGCKDGCSESSWREGAVEQSMFSAVPMTPR
jgi:chromosomal replication initiator protein